MKKIDELGISPAPWRYKNRGAVAYDLADVKCAWRGLARERYCTMVVHNAWDADARLIAAAPELYEALRGLIKVTLDTYWDRYWRGCEIAKERVSAAVENAKAALAKASGESIDIVLGEEAAK